MLRAATRMAGWRLAWTRRTRRRALRSSCWMLILVASLTPFRSSTASMSDKEFWILGSEETKTMFPQNPEPYFSVTLVVKDDLQRYGQESRLAWSRRRHSCSCRSGGQTSWPPSTSPEHWTMTIGKARTFTKPNTKKTTKTVASGLDKLQPFLQTWWIDPEMDSWKR